MKAVAIPAVIACLTAFPCIRPAWAVPEPNPVLAHLTPEERQRMREQIRQQWRQMSPEERQRQREAWREHWQGQPSELRQRRREEMRERWERLTPEQRERLRETIRHGARGEGPPSATVEGEGRH